MKRAAAISMAALLSVGGATTALVSIAGAAATDPSATTTTEAPAPAVTDLSSTLAGLGDISLTFDPITHEISNIVVTPLDGITAAMSVAVHNGIQLVFTLADGTVKTIFVEVEGDHGTVTLEFDNQSPEDAEQGGGHRSDGPPPIEDRGVSADHRNDNHDRHGPDVTNPPTTTPPTTDAPPVNSAPTQLGSSNRQESESQSGRNGRSGGRD